MNDFFSALMGFAVAAAGVVIVGLWCVFYEDIAKAAKAMWKRRNNENT